MKRINNVEFCNDKSIETIIKNKKIYYVCSVCGRLNFRKIVSHGKIYCNKHYKQLKNGGIKDANPRSKKDKNEIRIINDIAYIDLYDVHGNVIETAMIDAEDVDKIKYLKWRLSHGYVVTQRRDNKNDYLHRIVLDANTFVDHINHNPLDNRKSNLRIVNKSQNQMNSDYKGVSSIGNNKYYAHIKMNGKMLNLGVYIDKEEAYYARWYAETILFKDYQYYKKEKPIVSKIREKQIEDYVKQKVQRL